MGECEIPCIDFSGNDLVGGEGSEEWPKDMGKRVREACERHGWFLLAYDDENKISKQLLEEMFLAMKQLFDLPEETKSKYKCSRTYSGYLGKSPVLPLYESFGIDDTADTVALPELLPHFTNLMWPNGNPSFCDTLKSMSSRLQELHSTIMRMIFKSFGILEKYHELYQEKNNTIFRMMKYNAPPQIGSNCHDNSASCIALPAHTDKNGLTILCQNEVQGLEVLSKEKGNWIPVSVPQGCFVVIVGDALKAWSNGRLHAAKHRVKMNRNKEEKENYKERYSCGMFSLPKEGAVIEVPPELVDIHHPLLYRPFDFSGYVNFFASNSTADEVLIETYAAAAAI